MATMSAAYSLIAVATFAIFGHACAGDSSFRLKEVSLAGWPSWTDGKPQDPLLAGPDILQPDGPARVAGYIHVGGSHGG